MSQGATPLGRSAGIILGRHQAGAGDCPAARRTGEDAGAQGPTSGAMAIVSEAQAVLIASRRSAAFAVDAGRAAPFRPHVAV